MLGIILSLLLALAPCESLTGRTGHVIFPAFSWSVDADVINAYNPAGECVGTAETSYPEPFTLTVWGYDDLSAQYLGKTGIRENEPLRLAAYDGELEYNVSLTYRDDQPFYTTAPIYTTGMIAVAESAQPILQAATAGFTTDEVESEDGSWVVTFRLEADAPTGAVLLEFRTDGGASVVDITPAADTYISGDTLAASYIGAGSANVNFQISGTGYGTLSLHRIRGTDRNNNLLDITLGTESVAIVEPPPPPIVVDLDGDDTLTDSDVRALFLALIRDIEDQYPQADIFPFPQGDGIVNLLDFYYLNVANVTRRWPDGRDVQ